MTPRGTYWVLLLKSSVYNYQIIYTQGITIICDLNDVIAPPFNDWYIGGATLVGTHLTSLNQHIISFCMNHV